MPRDRRDKIRALLDSPIEGEREAARAALGRVERKADAERPAYGTVAWHEAVQRWCQKVAFCVSRLGDPRLSAAEVKLVRNFGKNRGDPWCMGAADLMAVYKKLKCEPLEQSGTAPTALI